MGGKSTAHTPLGVLRKASIQHRIGDLVADLVLQKPKLRGACRNKVKGRLQKGEACASHSIALCFSLTQSKALTGWPSFTDSDVNRKFCTIKKLIECRADKMK